MKIGLNLSPTPIWIQSFCWLNSVEAYSFHSFFLSNQKIVLFLKMQHSGMDTELLNLKIVHKLSEIVRTSLGPLGRDKLIVKSNGEMLVTNDGKTLLEEMKIKNPIGKLIVNLSKNQDQNVGDGTTSVVVFIGELSLNALELKKKGIHSIDIIEGYKKSLDVALKELKTLIIQNLDISDNFEELSKSSKTSLNSKMIGFEKEKLSKLCVEAVLRIYDRERKDIDLERIKFDYLPIGTLQETKLFNGIILWKIFSHFQMKPRDNCKMIVISFPLEVPKPKTKYSVNISNAEDYKELESIQHRYYRKVIEILSKIEFDLLICQWGIDEFLNQWLLDHNKIAIRYVAGDDIERISISTGSKICPVLDQMNDKMLGYCESISQEYLKDDTSIIKIENSKDSKVCSILVRGTNKLQCEDTIRSLYDSVCNVRNSILDNKLVVGGGSIECELYTKMMKIEVKEDYLDIYKSWVKSLLIIPQTLAENSGMNSLETVMELIHHHEKGNAYHGVFFDKNEGSGLCKDMKSEGVYENLKMKESVLKLATEMICLILKIDEIISFEE
jgi:T-complex protein 1 subunit epsilon